MFILAYVSKNVESPDKIYVYTVSGAGTSEVNGDYWDTGELIEGYPSYENANGIKIYCVVVAGLGQWVINQSTTGDPLYGAWWNGDTVYNPLEECLYWRTVDGSEPLPTVTKYNSSGSSGDSGDVIDPDKTYYYTVMSPEAELNGHYYDTGETISDRPIYENSNGCRIEWSDPFWIIRRGVGISPSYMSNGQSITGEWIESPPSYVNVGNIVSEYQG
jgi:hypothetical protein